MQQQSDVYSFQSTKDGKALISWRGKAVMTLKGNHASVFLASIEDAFAALVQWEMARITGNFKRGNERLMGQRKAVR